MCLCVSASKLRLSKALRWVHSNTLLHARPCGSDLAYGRVLCHAAAAALLLLQLALLPRPIHCEHANVRVCVRGCVYRSWCRRRRRWRWPWGGPRPGGAACSASAASSAQQPAG